MIETRLILLAHAPLASALRQLAAHTFADCAAAVEGLDVPADADLESTVRRLRSLLAEQPERATLVLVDVPGATPANALARVLVEFPAVQAVAGLNLPMLWRTLCYRAEPLPQLAERAVAGGLRSVVRVDPLPPL